MNLDRIKYQYTLLCLPYGALRGNNSDIKEKAKDFDVSDDEAEFIWDVIGTIAMDQDVNGYLDFHEHATFTLKSDIIKMLEITEPYKYKCPTFYEALVYCLENECTLYA